MADSNQHKRADFSGFADNDPFAELTRIMGHDPRPAQPAKPALDDDFEIDLEKELMGDFSDFDEEPAEAVAAPDWREELARDAAQDEPPAEMEAERGYAAAPERDDGYSEPAQQVPELDVAADHFDEAVAEDLSRVSDEEALDASPDQAPAWPAYEAVEPADAAPAALEAEARDDDLADAADGEDFELEFHEHELALDEEPEAAASDREVEAEAEPALAEGEISYADEIERFRADHEDLVAEYEKSAAEEEGYEPVSGAAPEDYSLEDELHALLESDKPVSGHFEAAVREDIGAPEAASHEREPGNWHPAVSTFGHVHPRDEWGEPTPEESGSLDEEAAAVAELDELEPSHGLNDGYAAEHEEPVEAAPGPAAPARGFDPFAILSQLGMGRSKETKAEDIGPLRPWRPETPPVQAVAAKADDDAPDIETIDVEEGARALADDLDIPNVDYEPTSPASKGYSELDGEFGETFNDFAEGGPADAAGEQHAADTHAEAQPVPFDRQHRDEAAEAASAPAHAYAVGEGHWQPDELDNGYENELERAVAMASLADEANPPDPRERRRGYMIAAVVGGLAIVGAVGLFGLSLFGGGGLGEPAVVLADSEPMKVRPKDPGGTTVPNQNSEAYQQVSGENAGVAPEQQSLITTAEEPADLAARAEPEAAATPVPAEEPASVEEAIGQEPALAPVAGDLALAEPEAAAPQPKSEDRIEQVAEQEGVGTNDDLIAVEPRKVRTLVVRPDGTMVPREEPASAAPASAEGASTAGESMLTSAPAALRGVEAPTTAAEASAPTVEVAAQQAAAEEETGVSTPSTVGVAPTPRSDTPAQQSAPEPTQVAAAPQAAAPTAQTSEWSMQIASELTADGAQSTYQALARRYGDVLQGRGVNIVRADIAGKGTYYRVRIPTANRDEAINLCTDYKSAGGSCFVSR